MKISALFAASLIFAALAPAAAQSPATDTLNLAELQAEAVQRDPRGAEFRLLRMQSALRMKNIGAERLPVVLLDSYAQYQSDVARIPVTLPGFSIPAPPHDSYDARLIAQQRIFDPSLPARRELERAQLGDAEAKVKTALYSLRQGVSDAYFTALAAQEHIAELNAGITDLEAQLAVALARVREGVVLPSEEYAIRAELLRRRQMRAERAAGYSAAIAILRNFTGRADGAPIVLQAPGAFTSMTLDVKTMRARPEYESFSAARELLDRQRSARAAQDKPRVFAYGRAGYGRPGLNPLATKFDSYWLAGVQLQWSPFNWGTTSRDREILELQGRIVESEEAAFTRAIERQVAQDREQIGRLEAALAGDEEIIALREKIFAETAAKYREGVVTAAEYVDKQTDVLSARIARVSHWVELAAARARVGNTIGVEIW